MFPPFVVLKKRNLYNELRVLVTKRFPAIESAICRFQKLKHRKDYVSNDVPLTCPIVYDIAFLKIPNLISIWVVNVARLSVSYPLLPVFALFSIDFAFFGTKKAVFFIRCVGRVYRGGEAPARRASLPTDRTLSRRGIEPGLAFLTITSLRRRDMCGFFRWPVGTPLQQNVTALHPVDLARQKNVLFTKERRAEIK